MTDISEEYCNLEIEFDQETDDGDFIEIELYCQIKKEHHKDFHLDSKHIEHEDNTTILHIQWSTIKTEELR